MSAIREARVEDAAAIARVHVASWRAAYDGLMPGWVLAGLDEEVRAERWRPLLERREGHSTLVIEDEGKIVGFVSLCPGRDESPPDLRVGEIAAIYVDPDSCGRGLGRALIDAGRRRLHNLDFSEATLWVLEGNDRARAFYAADGWRSDGASKVDELHGAVVHEVRYRRSLP